MFLIVAFLMRCFTSKEICEANTTIMCPMCEDTCEPWKLSDSCVYAKVSAVLVFASPSVSVLQTFLGLKIVAIKILYFNME